VPDDAPPALPPSLTELAPLLGTWTGSGHGVYPTIEPFDYVETIDLVPSPKGFVSYLQRTRRPSDGTPMHTETGYLRPAGPGRVELVVAQPTGVVEIDEGTVAATDGTVVVELRSSKVGTTTTAKTVEAVERTFRLVDDVLHVELAMAAVGVPMTHHLSATLRRQR
jgi:hypothetical protein